MSWFKDIFIDPRPDMLNTEIQNIQSRARQVGSYHVLWFEWADASLQSPNLHVKQLFICWFLLLDDMYRASVAARSNKSTRIFNTFMHKLETHTYHLVFGLQPNGDQYELEKRNPHAKPDWTVHCGLFAVQLINIASIVTSA